MVSRGHLLVICIARSVLLLPLARIEASGGPLAATSALDWRLD